MKKVFSFKSYLTFLSRNKGYTAINVFGFSLSMMFVLLIGIYAYQEYSVNSQVPDEERIYALGLSLDNSEKVGGFHHAFIKPTLKNFPDVESGCAVIRHKTKIQDNNGDVIRTSFLIADPEFLTMFDIPFVSGDRKTALDDNRSVVLSESFARKLFGSIDPVGKSLTWNDSIKLHITGVARDLGNISIEPADMIVNFSFAGQFNGADADELFPNQANVGGVNVFLLARKGKDLTKRADDLMKLYSTVFPPFGQKDSGFKLIVIPLKDLYFSTLTSYSNAARYGDRQLVNILFAVGMVILLFAVTNYINLTVSQSSRRAREMATRRLMGDSWGGIMARMMVESVCLCAISLAIGLLLALGAKPYIDHLLDTELHFAVLLHPASLALIALFVLAVGALSGFMPATVVSQAKPIDVVRGVFRFRTKMVLGRVFIVLQNVLTITMLASALTMTMQMHHLVSAPLGFDTKNIIDVPAPMAEASLNTAFVNELNKLPEVKMVSACQGNPAAGGNNCTSVNGGKTYSMQIFHGDRNYMKILGLKLDSDRNVTAENRCFVNPRFKADMKGIFYDGNMAKDPFTNTSYPIAGTTNQFSIRNITEAPTATVIFEHRTLDNPWEFLIKVEGNATEAYNKVAETYKAVYHEPLDTDYPFLEQQVRIAFEQQLRLSKIVALFAIISIVVSLLGLVAMSTYFIQQRSKEIAIRKVFGSTGLQVRRRLISSFLAYVLVAFVIAAPASWWIMGKWISQYSYRIEFWPWIIVAGVVSLAMSFAAVFAQSFAASNANPADKVKDE